MARSDRLFDITTILRDGKRHRAEDLARRLGVSTRTIWRDMDALARAGIPLRAERGRGYRLEPAITLPPLTLTEAQYAALTLGLAVVAEAADDDLRSAAAALADKIDAQTATRALPEADAWKLATTPFADTTRTLAHMPLLRSAIRARQKVRITHALRDGSRQDKVLRPLQMENWGKLWTLTAWCESGGNFEVFRMDLIDTAEALPELFVDEPGKTLADYAP